MCTALDQVAEARDSSSRRDALAQFLLRHARHRGDALVEAAADALATDDALRVAALADTLDVSVDTLEKRFRRAVGAGPKQLAMLVRLGRAVAAHRAGAPLTRAAQHAGYFDQSHFIGAFRAVSGESPACFFAAGTDG